MQIVYKGLEKLTPYKNNPRYNDEAVESVAKSIQDFGFKVPIVIDKDGVIVTGHTRYKAAMRLGYTEVPCIIADDLNEEQVKAFRIADNKTSDLSIWDNKLLLGELEELSNFDYFTGFDMVDISGNIEALDERDTSTVDNNDYGVFYEVLFRSAEKEKIERIKAQWEEMGGNDE